MDSLVNDTKRKAGRPVGRPRAFDREAALDSAIQVFWEYGYEAASISMLCESMGLTSPQLYNAYTDKENLFLLALDRYVARESEFVVRALDSDGTAKEAVSNLLVAAAATYTRPDYPRGCLIVTAAIVAPPACIRVVEALREGRKAAEQRIAARLSRDSRELPAGVDIAQLARFFAAVLLGMSIQSRDGKCQQELLGYAEMALRAWPEGTQKASKID